MQVRVTTWKGPQLTRTIEREIGNRLDKSGKVILKYLVTSISIQGSYVPPFHSTPGFPPFRQTGDLIDSWKVEVDTAGLEMRVSSDSPYVLALELGRPEINLAPRPHARRAFYNNLSECVQIICQPM